MKPPRLLVGCAVLSATLAGAALAAADDAVRGAALYQAQCAACHAPDFNGVGPRHRGVVGRKAGAVPGFAYSPALKNFGALWSDALLDRWLADPETLVPGQRMGVNVPEGRDRADLIAFLKKLSAKE